MGTAVLVRVKEDSVVIEVQRKFALVAVTCGCDLDQTMCGRGTLDSWPHSQQRIIPVCKNYHLVSQVGGRSIQFL